MRKSRTTPAIVHTTTLSLLDYKFQTLDNVFDTSEYPERKLVRKINDHHQITYSCRNSLPPPLAARDFLSREIWKVEDDKSIVLIVTSVNDDDADLPENHVGRTSAKHVVRGEMVARHRFTPLPFGQTSYSMTLKVDFKGTAVLPTTVVHRGIVTLLNAVSDAAQNFERSEEIDELARLSFIDR